MAIRKRDPVTGRRFFWNAVFTGIPFTAIFLFALYAHRQGRMDWFYTAVAIGMGVIWVGVVRQRRWLRPYHCPDCGKVLEKPCGSPDGYIEYLCPDCDVIWETGLAKSSD